MKKTLSVLFALLMVVSASAQETVLSTFNSPDNNNIVTVCRETSDGTIYYRMTHNGKNIINNSALGMSTNNGDFTQNLLLTSQSESVINQSYKMWTGKFSTVSNKYKEKTLTFKANNGSGNEFDVIFRAYNDGVAFRYYFKGSASSNFIVNSDNSKIALNGFNRCWGQKWSYDYSQGMGIEFDWTAAQAMTNGNDTRLPLGCFAPPLLVESTQGDDSYCLITDAGVDRWFSRAIPHAESTTGKFGFAIRGTKSNGLEVTTNLPLYTPWRCAIIGKLTEIAVSNMTENCADATVADPSGSNWSWVKPGFSSWDWGGQQSADLKNRTDFNIAIEYIDFASSMGWQYFTLDEGWSSSKESATGTSDGYVKGICSYALSKGIGVHIWNSSGSMTGGESGYEATFKQWHDWGCVGAKIDFFYDGDTRGVMEKQELLAKTAAKYQMMINFHGTPTPTGLRRKYPNIVAYEAVDGNEDYFTGGWNNCGTDPGYNGLLTLLRTVVGPMDYTICEFRDGLTGTGRVRNNTSWAQQLAHMVTMECGVQYIADHPKNISNNNTLVAAMKNVPTAWDESKCLQATIGTKGKKDCTGNDDVDCTVLWARRKGNNWYVGATTNAKKTITIDCSQFLGDGTFKVTIYKDGALAVANSGNTNADDIATEIRENITKNAKIDVTLAQWGGCFVRFDCTDTTSADVLEAEDAKQVNGTKIGLSTGKFNSSGQEIMVTPISVSDATSASNGKKVINTGWGNNLDFTYTAKSAGIAYLTLAYATAEQRYTIISVNAELPKLMICESTGSNSAFATQVIETPIKAGDNKIVVGGTNLNWAPDLDYISILMKTINTDIKPIYNTSAIIDNNYYNINGQRVVHPVKGIIYIHEGKKVFLK